MVSRRNVIRTGALAAASLCLPLPRALMAGAAAKTAATQSPRPGDVFSSSANFRPHLGTPFRLLTGPQQTADVRLTQVTDAAAAAFTKTSSGAAGPCFSLAFDAKGAGPLGQGTYTVSHAALGSFQMFLAPVGRSGQFEAVVNRRLA